MRGLLACLIVLEITISVAAAEVAVGLALVISVYRHYKSVDLEKMQALQE